MRPIELRVGHVYRIAWNIERPELRGRPCVYHGMVRANAFDVPRAEVDVDGARWFVRPALIIVL